MEIQAAAHFSKRPHSDALVVPFFARKGAAVAACKGHPLKSELKAALDAGDFTAREGELAWLYVDTLPEVRVALLGLGDGDKVTTESLRRAYASLARGSQSKKLKKLNVFAPDAVKVSDGGYIRGLSEGLLLANYSFSGRKAVAKDRQTLIEKVTLVGASAKDVAAARKFAAISQGVNFARDLVNGNADDITPQHFIAVARQLAKRYSKIKASIFDKKRLVKEKFGLILAVNRGSRQDPAMVVLEYKGAPKSSERIVLVGKGVTYDTGGLNLKPTGSMETMKADMAGAAAVLGALQAAASLGLKRNITVVIPSTENSIDADSYKPGDVYTGYAGKSVEIGNTDAEGRLILADALAYAVEKLRPTYLINLATLTGAMDVALGNEVIGLFSNSDKLSALLEKASSESYERVWRLPLVEEYREQLKSDIADLKNMGGRGAGSIKAALFLEEFVGKTPWAHLDIAAVAFSQESKRYHPKYGTGVGVRLLMDFLESL